MINVSTMVTLVLVLLRMMGVIMASAIHVDIDYFEAGSPRRAALVSIRSSYAVVFGEVDLDVNATDRTVLVR